MDATKSYNGTEIALNSFGEPQNTSNKEPGSTAPLSIADELYIKRKVDEICGHLSLTFSNILTPNVIKVVNAHIQKYGTWSIN